jgi:F-type H+-transporting ATPase subunit b
MVVVALLCSLLPAVALAAGTAHDGSEHATSTAQWLTLGFTFVNFLLFFFLIRRFARAPLRDYLTGRRKDAVAAMAEAAKAKDEADRLKCEYEEKAARLEETRRHLVDEIRAIAEADRERALAAAEEAAERLRRDAERTAQSDLERARRELRAEAARLATELASTEIRERLSSEQLNRLIGEFLARVEHKQ